MTRRVTQALVSWGVIGLLLTPRFVSAQWSEDDRERGCVRYKGERRGDTIPIRAVCIWPLSPQALRAVLSRPEHYDRCFSRVEKSDRVDERSRQYTSSLSSSSPLIRIYQVHDASPASDRALYLDYRITSRDRAWRISFHKTPESESAPITKYIEVKRNEGYWQVEPHLRGAKLTLESLYDPGGAVPSFMVRWFLSGGVQKTLDELRACAKR